MIGIALVATVIFTAESSWELVERDGELEVWTRPRENSDFDEIRARIEVPASMEQVWAILEDVERYREFMPYLEDARILERVSDRILYQYQKVDPPLLDARDFVMRIEIERGAGAIWRRYRAAAHPASPRPSAGTVRVSRFEGEWIVRALGSDRTEIVYRVLGDPGGAVPAWIANYGNTISIPRLMHALRERVLDRPR